MSELTSSPLFEGLDDELVQTVKERGERMTQPEDEPLFCRGDQGNWFYTILDGLVKITVPDPLSERSKTLALLTSGDVIGEMALLTDQTRSGRATPARETTLFKVHQEDFQDLVETYPKIAINLSKILSRRLWDTDSEVQFVTFKTIPGRLATQLIRLAEQFGDRESGEATIDIQLTHQELADIVGTNRETVTRHLNKFRSKDLIDFDDNELVIKNWERLEGWT